MKFGHRHVCRFRRAAHKAVCPSARPSGTTDVLLPRSQVRRSDPRQCSALSHGVASGVCPVTTLYWFDVWTILVTSYYPVFDDTRRHTDRIEPRSDFHPLFRIDQNVAAVAGKDHQVATILVLHLVNRNRRFADGEDAVRCVLCRVFGSACCRDGFCTREESVGSNFVFVQLPATIGPSRE